MNSCFLGARYFKILKYWMVSCILFIFFPLSVEELKELFLPLQVSSPAGVL